MANDEQILDAQQAADLVKVGIRIITRELKIGRLPGRNLGGRRGWVTTRRALLDWVESGNKDAALSEYDDDSNGEMEAFG